MGCGATKVAVVISHVASSDPTSDVSSLTSVISVHIEEQAHPVTGMTVHNNSVYIVHENTPKIFIYNAKGKLLHVVKVPKLENPYCIIVLDGNREKLKFVAGDFPNSLKWMSMVNQGKRRVVIIERSLQVGYSFVSICANTSKRYVMANDVASRTLHLYGYDGEALSRVTVGGDVYPHQVTLLHTGEGYIVSDPIRRQLVWLAPSGKITRRVSLIVDDAGDGDACSTSSDITTCESTLSTSGDAENGENTVGYSATYDARTQTDTEETESEDDYDDIDNYFIPGHVVTDTYGRLLLTSHSRETSSVLLLSRRGEYMATLLKHCSHPVVESAGETLCVIHHWSSSQQLMVLDYPELCKGVFPFQNSHVSM